MNSYELLFDEIVKQTRAGQLRWTQIRRTANADLIFEQSHVFRQFETQLIRGDSKFTVLLVEKKFENDDWESITDTYRPEILVLNEDGELMVTLTDFMIEKSRLAGLAHFILGRSESLAKLLDEQAEAATIKP